MREAVGVDVKMMACLSKIGWLLFENRHVDGVGLVCCQSKIIMQFSFKLFFKDICFAVEYIKKD